VGPTRPAGPAALAALPASVPCAPPPRLALDCDRRRGPSQLRDLYLLAQPRLTLPSPLPDTVGCRRTELRAFFHWSNSFGFHQSDTGDGEEPIDRRYLVDGEARTLEVEAVHGVADDVDVAVRVPLHGRGAGTPDEVIDLFHETTSFVTLDNDRDEFDVGRWRVEGRTLDGGTFDWEDVGTGLGDVEAWARWRFLDGGRDRLSLAAVARVSLPTSTGPFEPGGVGAGLQVVGALRVLRTVDVFAGTGGTWQSDTGVDDVEFRPFRGHGFAGVEWRPAPCWSVVLTLDGAGRLVEDVPRFPAEHVYFHVDAKVDVSSRTTIEIGFTENLNSQQTTADFAVHAGVTVRL
jgi:hypothetical protein